MWCLISQSNSMVFEVRVDPRAIGEECLEKACKVLGISNESDYFGLKYESNKGEELWLNLRNAIDRQVARHEHQSPRLALRVKFWVPPHLLLQDTTRHQFYEHARVDLLEHRLLPTDWDAIVRIAALVAQAETGNCDPNNNNNNHLAWHGLYQQWANLLVPVQEADNKPEDLLQRIVAEHRKCKDMKRTTAEYWLLKEISEFENFGEELFTTKHQNAIRLGVGPHGITVYEAGKDKHIISFTNIISASSHKRTFKLEYFSMDNKESLLEIKLDSNHIASSLYRAITEKHAFYSCETVRSAVTAQFIRDLKGTIVSIFNEDSTLGKKYVFDIRRTCREVYDNARRALYQENAMQSEVNGNAGCDHEGDHCKDSEERLTRLMDALTCKICMDNQIDSVFLPCAHVVACTTCAERCDRCPVCRGDITRAQKLFLPGEFRQQIC